MNITRLILIIFCLVGINSRSNSGIVEMAEKYNIAGNFGKGALGIFPVLPAVLMFKMEQKFDNALLSSLSEISRIVVVPIEARSNWSFILYEKYPNQTKELNATKSFFKRIGKRIIPYIPFALGKAAIIIPAIIILRLKNKN